MMPTVVSALRYGNKVNKYHLLHAANVSGAFRRELRKGNETLKLSELVPC